MKLLQVIILLALLAVAHGCTLRSANARIINRSGKKIIGGTLVHRYSTEYTEKGNFSNIAPDATSSDVLKVYYHTGFGCNGRDYWLVTWMTEDGETYSIDPDNGLCWISILENSLSDLLGAFSSLTGGLTNAVLTLTSTITKYAVSGDDFCGFKVHTLTSSDEDNFVNIYIYSYTNNGIKISSASDSSTTDYSVVNTCFSFVEIPNTDLSGHDIGDTSNPPLSPRSQACCTLCALNPDCQSYTWNSDNQKCFFKTYSNGIGSSASIAQSGVRQNGAAFFAVKNAWDFFGNDLTSSNTADYTACAAECKKNSQCKTFTFIKDSKLCLLKSDAGYGGASKNNLESGYRGDFESSFYQPVCYAWHNDGSCKLSGNDLLPPENAPKVDSFTACASLCYHTKLCQSFNWHVRDKWCYLKTSSGAKGDRNEAFRSGVRTDGPSYFEILNGWDFPGNDLSSSITSSFYACGTECTRNADCKTFTYIQESKLCLLKSSSGDGGKVKANLNSAYYGEFSQYYPTQDSWEFVGNDLIDKNNPPIVDSLRACIGLCQITAKCQSCNWNRETSQCYLKSSSSGGVVSNWRMKSAIRTRRDVVKEIQPDVGPHGEFQFYEYCPSGSWAYGFQIRVESRQGSDDDTALNAVRLFCRTKAGVYTGDATSYVGIWGGWGNNVYCGGGNDQFMYRATFKIEEPQGTGDDTSANDFKSLCWNGNTGSNTELVANNGGEWGTWRASASCPVGSAICGISPKFDPSQGGGLNDDTAMNGAYFKCCTL